MLQGMRTLELKVGDIVHLKSEGPSMTVEEIQVIDGKVRCQWFAGKRLESGVFAPESLVRAEEEPQGG